MHMKYYGIKMEKLYALVMSMLPDEEAVNAEKNRPLWNPLLNYVVYRLNCCASDGEVDRYSSTEEVIINSLEKEEILARTRCCPSLFTMPGQDLFAEHRLQHGVAMKFWLGKLAVALKLEKGILMCFVFPILLIVVY